MPNELDLTGCPTITIPPTMPSGDGIAVLVPDHQYDEWFHHVENLCMPSQIWGVGPLLRRILWAFYFITMAWLSTEQRASHLRQGPLPGYIGMELASSMILVEPSGSKAALTNLFGCWPWNCDNHVDIRGPPALRSFIYKDAGGPTGKMQAYYSN